MEEATLIFGVSAAYDAESNRTSAGQASRRHGTCTALRVKNVHEFHRLLIALEIPNSYRDEENGHTFTGHDAFAFLLLRLS
jgi:hypothetical protein